MTAAHSPARILFVHNAPTTFVVLDRDLLAERWQVQERFERSRLINVRQLLHSVRASAVVFGWFASWHTFLPVWFARRLNKPSILVVGGYDIANLPQIGYGHLRGGLSQWISQWLLTHATTITTFSEFSRGEIAQNAAIDPKYVSVIYLAVPDALIRLPSDPRPKLILTVGNVNHSNLTRKGHLAFVKAASYLPQADFILAGRWQDDAIGRLRAIASPNVTFTNWLSATELRELFIRASVYVQASQHEGFGLAVAEAMLAGCMPVVTRVGALPEVVGDSGIYLQDDSPETMSAAIQQAVHAALPLRQRARDRVLENFSIERRRAGLNALVERALAR